MVKFNINFNLEFTISKLLGLGVFITGAFYAFINKQADVLINSAYAAITLVGVKTIVQNKKVGDAFNGLTGKIRDTFQNNKEEEVEP